MIGRVQVRAPCRLHFGMFSFGHADRPQFGGVGMMVDPPAVEVTIRPAASFAATGELAGRVHQFVDALVERWQLGAPPACRIRVVSPPDHVGLGVGTQLGLAVAVGLRRFLALPELSIEDLAASAGRGGRSAVGTHGFRLGGLIVDAGKQAGQSPGELFRRVDVPPDWRVVLVRCDEAQGLAGQHEAEAFDRLPPVPDAVTRELWRITQQQILPAIEQASCSSFGEAAYQFGRLAGECFAPVQGGAFASDKIALLIQSLRKYGVPGVGQSSWGPTVFAFTPDEAKARELAEWLRHRLGVADQAIVLGRPSNGGAQVNVS